MTVTISEATQHITTTPEVDEDVAELASASSLDFALDPEAKPIEAMQQATAAAAMALSIFLRGTPNAAQLERDVQAVVTELVDVTARHKAGTDLVGKVVYDGAHVTVSIGDMDCPLPPPETEPGLYLVHRVAAEVGQYAGDHGGRVTWAAVPVGT